MKKTRAIVMVVCMSVLLLGCLVFLYLIVGTNIFFKNLNENETDVVVGNVPQVGNNDEEEELIVAYNGGTLYAGGRAVADDFVVELVNKKGKKKITKYKCSMLEEGYRLQEGSNTFVFYYNDLSAVITLDAVNAESKSIYAPTYVTKHANDMTESKEKVEMIKSGKMTYADALADVMFVGDSQIAALTSFNILTGNNVEAEVGASADFIEKRMEQIVTKASGKKAIVIHFGINSLSSSLEERNFRIKQYRELIGQLQELLPDIRVIVSGLFPVHPSILYSKSGFVFINNYNYELLHMCMDDNYEYYSNNEYLNEHLEMFSGDGLHLNPTFYKDYWVYDLIETMGL